MLKKCFLAQLLQCYHLRVVFLEHALRATHVVPAGDQVPVGTVLATSELDPSASYKKKLAQYSLYGHHGRGDEETKEGVVRGSWEEKKRE